ncbi:protein lev-9-like isoform X2 [Oculina patagonica]
MKYAVFFLALFAVHGVRCQNCTRTNTQPNVCSKSCDPSQDGCKGSTRDCMCDGDCGYSCVKRDLRCKKLTIDNGRVRYGNATFGSVARYRCTPPYTLEGSRKRTCRGNGEWDSQKPICKLICKDPGSLPNGQRKHNGFELGKQVEYRCLPGFTMQGSSTLTCTRTGAWDKVKPSCTCVRTNKEAFRYCRKQCDPDSGCSRDRQCVCDGDCGYSCIPKVVDCGKPSVLENGREEYSSTTFLSTVRYRCNKPYTLLGSKIRTCRGIRRWDGTEPSCKIICKDPGDINNGNKQIFRRNYDEDYVAVGDRAEYTCFPGYKMEGSKYLTCTSSGEWNQAKPKCLLPSCNPPKLPDNSEIRGSTKSSYKYSDKVFLKCKTGYFTIGIGLLTCGSDGWTSRSFTCSPKSCGNPGNLPNGKLKSYIFTFKSKVYFECNHGYKLVGDKYRQCQANQRWGGKMPTCEPIDCGVLQTPDKAEKVFETHTRVGGVVRFKCKEKGYEISGSEIRTCQNDESWSGFPTSCKIISCGDPGTPLHGKQTNVKNGYNYGSSVEFICNDNYTLSGRSKIYCEETKDWSSPNPRCWAPCSDPGMPGNGRRIDDDFRHGKSVSFKCKADYELKGKATISCNDGTWSNDIPQCTVISCPDPGSPANGRQTKVSNNFAVGGFVRFKCNENYTLIGESKITCQRGKMWSGNVPKCSAPCLNPGQPTNGRRIGSVFVHNSVVQFECYGDRFLKGSYEMKCNNGQWGATLPTCIDCNGGIPLGMESGKIPDESITASSQTHQHPAHHGRLAIGRDTYWCSNDEAESYIDIRLPKRYKITYARVQIQNGHKVQNIALQGQNLQKKWIDYHYKKGPYSSDVERIVPDHPFASASLRIMLRKKERTPICLRAEVYGCEIPRDCIMPGSIVLIKEKAGYRKGFVGGIFSDRLEVFLSGKRDSTLKNKADVILDEKPHARDLTRGTLVLGEDVNSPGLIRKGKIEQIGDTTCTIKTNDKTWNSKLKDIRIVKISNPCKS